MAEAPSITVVVPAYNAERYLERAVESVWATGYENSKVVIVDDGSSDGTAAVAERLCAAYPTRCRLLRHPGNANRGVSASRNLGIESSDSEWLAFLDADDFFLPWRFDAWRQIVASGAASIDAIYELAEVRCEEAGEHSGLGRNGAGDAMFGIRNRLAGMSLLAELLRGSCWQASTVTVRRTLLAATGLFDTGKRIAEDCHLWMRLAAFGKVAAGDLDRPVSVYWRHQNNTYQYRIEHRVALLVAMLDAWRWARKKGLDEATLRTFSENAEAYALRSIIAAREAGRRTIALQMLWKMARSGDVAFMLAPTTIRQLAGMTRRIA